MMNHILYNGISLTRDAEYFLYRPHIDNLLKTAIEKPVTTVIAGAGYGKTHAVSGVIESLQYKAIWLQLSELDNLVARLWERFIYAFESYSENLAKDFASLGYPESIASFDRFLHLIAKEIMNQNRFVIILDDFHSIHNKTILNFFGNIISAQIQNLSIILISRTKPNLSLVGMLSKGLLARITEDDLRFSRDEMEAYYRRQGANLSGAMISNIYSYTEGWIFAIYLVGLSIKKGNIYDQNPMFLAKIDIFELIEKEVFEVASKKLQKFLIQISILDAIPVGLLNELAHHDPSIVIEMTRISLFIRYELFSDSYRLHHLFKAFLLERASKLKKEETIKIHLTAAKWYENHNHLIEAVNHYEECNCYGEVFDIILSVRERVAKEVADSFIRLIDRAPEKIIQARPIILVMRAKYLFNNNRIQEAHEELLHIREKYEALPKTSENQSVLGETYITLALISIVSQDLEFQELFKMAEACLPKGSTLVDYRLSIAEGINVCGIKNPVAGELKRYQDALFNAAPYASRVMNGCGQGMEYLNAADSALMVGDIINAEKNAYEAIYRAGQKQQYGIEYMANFILIRIYVYKGDYPKIAITLKKMKDQLESLQNSDCISLYDIIEGWFNVKTGETSKICKWIMHEDETRKMLAPVILGREYHVHSDCLLAEERYYELLAFMEHTDKLYELRGVLYALIQNRITKAIIHHYLGEHQESMDALYAAYELSSPNKLIIQYIEYGSKMRTLLHTAIQDKKCKVPKAWMETIYTKSSTYAKRLAQVSTEYRSSIGLDRKDQINLSKRELEVLSCLCHGLTRDEIAVSSNLSINTVKSILQNIYNKLGASNSMDAVRIASMMNLLS